MDQINPQPPCRVFMGATTSLVVRRKLSSRRQEIINCLPPLETAIAPFLLPPPPPPRRDLFLLKVPPRCLKHELAPGGSGDLQRAGGAKLGRGESPDRLHVVRNTPRGAAVGPHCAAKPWGEEGAEEPAGAARGVQQLPPSLSRCHRPLPPPGTQDMGCGDTLVPEPQGWGRFYHFWERAAACDASGMLGRKSRVPARLSPAVPHWGHPRHPKATAVGGDKHSHATIVLKDLARAKSPSPPPASSLLPMSRCSVWPRVTVLGQSHGQAARSGTG